LQKLKLNLQFVNQPDKHGLFIINCWNAPAPSTAPIP
jgi:hypothetical protein